MSLFFIVYDHNGQRVRKVVGGTTTEYTVNGTKVVHVAKGSEWLHVYYDGQGRPGMASYKGTIYHYMYNLQGDVVGLVDGSGNVVVEYKYDVWGKIIGRSGSLVSTLGNLNPFRYRGYVYDEETGLYYLRSRYYNPEWGRFISADILMGKRGALLSHNLFAYCRNNPVMCLDGDGKEAESIHLYYDSEGNYLFYHKTVPTTLPQNVIDGIVTAVATAEALYSWKDVAKGMLQTAGAARKLSARAVSGKGPRAVHQRMWWYATERNGLGSALQEMHDSMFTGVLEITTVAYWVRKGLENIKYYETIPYEEGDQFRNNSDYKVTEIEMKPYPSRYFTQGW